MKIKLDFILLFFIALFTGCNSAQKPTDTSNQTPPTAVVNAPKPNETSLPPVSPPERVKPIVPIQRNAETGDAKKPDESNVVTTTFDKIQKGMNYREVAAIIGSPGENAGEFKVEKGSIVMYRWKGKTDKGDWILSAKFENGKLTDKSQFGLK